MTHPSFLRYHACVQVSPLLTTPLLVAAAAVAAFAIALRVFPHIGLLDFPERYGLVRKRLPYPGGIVAVGIFIVFFVFYKPLTLQSLSIVAAVGIVGVLSFLDDRWRIPALPRLVVQIGVAALIFWAGDCTGNRICSITSPFGVMGGSPVIDLMGVSVLLSFAVTTFWLLLTMNALNWFDGIPGQVNVLSCIGFVTIGLLALSMRVNQPEVALLSFVLAAIAAAAAVFDLPPARMIMGDSGAMFFGLMLGILTIYAGGKVATAFLVLGVPILDLFLVVLRRLRKGTSPLQGSLHGEHLHHRLLERGLSAKAIITLTAVLGGAFGGAALFLSTFQKLVAACILLCVLLGVSRYADSPRHANEQKIR